MSKEETEEAPEWAKREIAAAIDILKSDGIHIHRTYKSFMESVKPEKEDPKEGDPPPPKDEPNQKPRKSSAWWGSRLEDD